MGMVVHTKTVIAIALLALVLFSVTGSAQTVQPDSDNQYLCEEQDSYVPGEVLVLVSADTNKNGLIEETENFVSIDTAIPGKIKKRINLSPARRVLRVKLPKSKSVKAALKENWKKRDPRILVVEPNYRLKLHTTPDDQYFPYMWQLDNIGQSGGIADADIDAPQAWDITTGDSDIIIAVIDSGVDYLHPDLADNMWVNKKEKKGRPGVDDDRNGYIDDIYGYDFYQNDGDPSDAAGHGTHCAGIIAAVGNNALGTTGVNWKCRIMSCRFLSALGGGNTADAIEAINYAVSNGAKILNNSWGGGQYSASLEAAIANAYENGVLFVTSAGNINRNIDIYPAYPASYRLPNVIAVAATNHKDQRAYFSNYGPESVHLAAPGQDIISTIPFYKTIFYEDFQDANIPGFEGTSMIPSGPANRWGTIQNDLRFEGNILAHVDWENSWPYLPDSNSFIETPAMDTTNARALTLYFVYRYQIGSTDLFTADVWDGENWNTIFSRNSDCCYLTRAYFYIIIDIPEAYRNEQMKVRFNWVTDSNDSDYFGVEIDRIRLQCIADSNEDYQFKNGTSMAAPHVAGAAGLLLANNPDMCLSELKNRLIKTGNKVADLEGKTISCRRLNLINALAESQPLKLTSPNGGEKLITGSDLAVTWSSFNCGPVDIYLLKKGSIYRQLAENIENFWTFNVQIPEDVPEGDDYQVLIGDQTQIDISDETFSIRPPIILYVDDNSADGGNGRNWYASFNDLQDALDEALLPRDEIHVAQGTYLPSMLTDPCNPRSATFQLINQVTVKGGYAGIEGPDPNERNPEIYETILSGDLYDNDTSDPNRTENCYHVLTVDNTDHYTVLDGFTVTAGNANGKSRNSGEGAGAGMFNKSGKPTVVNCKFINNSAKNGGAILNKSGSLAITNCLFISNSAGIGGAIHSNSGDLYAANCAFFANTARKNGGAIHCYSSRIEITNCTISNNWAIFDGGGVFNRECELIINNSILFNNTDSGPVDESAQILNYSSSAVVNYSCIQGFSGTLSGNNNIDLDPLFRDPNGIDEIPGTIDDNLRLSPESPCIDAADPQYIPQSATDLDGKPRIFNDRIDMGAYEFIPNRPPVAAAGQDQPCYTWFDTDAEVTLDASNSYDPDSDPLTYNWQWKINGSAYDANSQQPIIYLPVDHHTI
ncbi:MAG: S8 family serine peptidase, partial [Planctomycetota bacterium]